MRFLKTVAAFAVAMLLVCVPIYALAQAATPAPAAGAIAPPDWTALGIAVITGLSGAATILITWGARWLMATKIPKVIWPIVAFGLGYLATYLSGLTGLDPLWGAVVGFGSVVVRDLIALFAANGLSAAALGAKIKLF